MSVLRPSERRVGGARFRGLVALLIAAALTLVVAPARAAARAEVRTDHGCYLVGQRVRLTGSGFAPSHTVDVTVDGVDFGHGTTGPSGGFANSLFPGGLRAGIPQHVARLEASDGTRRASALFTITRKPGARFQANSGNPATLRAPFQVWGFSRTGAPRRVYVHYVRPSGSVHSTVGLGSTGGQCGYLLTRRRRVFPFTPSHGTWTLQVDTHNGYARRPSGPVARIRVKIS